MPPPLRSLPSLVSLVPQSGIQFLDLPFALERLPRTSRSFWEEPLPPGKDPAAAAPSLVSLRELTPDPDGALIDPVSGTAPPA